MSFSLEFIAASKADAIAIVDQRHAPAEIKTFLKTGIVNIREDGAILVKAVGHLCDGPNSYETTLAQIDVRRVHLATPAPAS